MLGISDRMELILYGAADAVSDSSHLVPPKLPLTRARSWPNRSPDRTVCGTAADLPSTHRTVSKPR
jgi:hypothetical protein